MMVLYYYLQLRGKGHRDFVVAADFFLGGFCGNVISMLRQELREDLHGHETPTFLGSPAFVCMSYTFVSRGDSFCQSSTPECRKKKKKR